MYMDVFPHRQRIGTTSCQKLRVSTTAAHRGSALARSSHCATFRIAAAAAHDWKRLGALKPVRKIPHVKSGSKNFDSSNVDLTTGQLQELVARISLEGFEATAAPATPI